MTRKSLLLALAFLLGTGHLIRAQQVSVNAERPQTSREYPPKFDGADVFVYKSIGQTELKLYVFKPADHQPAERRPAIVFFFGGGWRGGTPAQFTEHCKYFASRGMVAMAADYRVASRHGTKAVHCVADAKSAIRWLRKNAERLGVDPDRIVASGGSAGGHLAACTGVVAGMEEPGEDTRISSQPNALVLFNPVLALTPIGGVHPLGDRAEGLAERVGVDPKMISPFDHVEAGQPPTIIFFGTDDRLLAGAEHFQRAAEQVGNRCELLTWDGLPHGFFNYGRFNNQPYLETVHAADKFMASLGYLAGDPTVAAPQQVPQPLIPRERFEIRGRPAFVILPAKDKPKRNGSIPWLLYAPTFDRRLPSDREEGWMMRRLLDKGIAIAGVDIGESYGNPNGRTIYNALHKTLAENYKFDPQACLLARSRGGLMLYCWAVENPEKVRCIAGIYPVCDIASYPGIGKACNAYGMTETELAATLDRHNPIPRLAALAKSQAPIFHIHGDQDKVVPLEANSAALAEAYRKLGGSMQLKVASGQGHNMWRGFFECHELVDFVIANATGKPNTTDAPKPISR